MTSPAEELAHQALMRLLRAADKYAAGTTTRRAALPSPTRRWQITASCRGYKTKKPTTPS